MIVDSTNQKINLTLSNITDEVLQDDTHPYLQETNKCEVYAQIGVMYFRGLLGQNMHDVNHIFSERSRHPIFGGTMSKCRFTFLLSHLCFDNFETCLRCWQCDRLTAFREIFDLLNAERSQHVSQSEYLPLD